MLYIAAALVVFKVTQFVKNWVEAPFWAVWLFTTGLAALVVWLAGGNPAWCLAVSAGSGLFHRVEVLLMVASDAAKVSVLRNTRRR